MITAFIFRKIAFSGSLILFISWNLRAQPALERYVSNGLTNNLVIHQKNISLEKAMYSLKIANSYFLPSSSIKFDYQSGKGGRSIAIPTGDLLNPVYSTLNQLTSSNNFPQISNAETNFFPWNFYDAKIRTNLFTINSDIFYQRKIGEEQIALHQDELKIYMSELSKNIRVAYYNYLSALSSIRLYDLALEKAREAKRINESLLRNGKLVKAYLIRSESVIRNLEAQKVASEEQSENALLYFRFLINDESRDPIDTSGAGLVDREKINLCLIKLPDASKRPELDAMNHFVGTTGHVLKMNRSYWYPRVNAFLDLGSQSSDWKFNAGSRYFFAGVQMDVPVFSSGRSRYKIRQSELDLKQQVIQSELLNKQLRLSVESARNKLKTAYEKYLSSLSQETAAMEYDRLIQKGYQEGVYTFIESLDAGNQSVEAGLQAIISKYQLQAALAVYEREINPIP